MDAMQIDTIPQYAKLLGFESLHPLVTVIDLADMPEDRLGTKRFGFYCVMLKEHYNGILNYGRGKYNYKDGTMLFTSPGQSIGVNIEAGTKNPQGYLLMFHPDFIVDTTLGLKMNDFFFFSYDSNEALITTEEERITIRSIFKSIRHELMSGSDAYTKGIITSSIDTLLCYCLRFYDRQFASRKHDKKNIQSRLDAILEDFFAKDKGIEDGIPSVRFCASCLHLSPNYFGDRIKKETGRSAQEYIHDFIVNKAKAHLISTSMSISEIAYHLGFNYPHHFTRLFKRKSGHTPSEYRESYAI